MYDRQTFLLGLVLGLATFSTATGQPQGRQTAFDRLDRNRDGWLYSTEYLFTWQAWMNSLPSGWNRDGNASPKPTGKETRRSKNSTREKSW
ncbi:MAG: hypothetical protein QGH11_10475 [Pirellulaceae bacterium]|nr:hypothetical protein [Pirellulaceae bacterium]